MVKYEYAMFSYNYFYSQEDSDLVYVNGVFNLAMHQTAVKNLVTFLNELGEQGWELIKVDDEKYFFKREVSDALAAERKAERKAREEEKMTQMTDVEKAYYLVENTPELQHSSVVYGYIAKVKQNEMTFEEFKVKVDELLNQ